MATIEEAVVTLLNAHAGLNSLVVHRIYPNVLPERVAHPAIAFFRVGGERHHSLSGVSRLASARFQFDCFAKGADGYRQVKRVCEQLRKALDGYRGIVTVGAATVNIQFILCDGEEDIFTSQVEVHGVTMDFQMLYQEV